MARKPLPWDVLPTFYSLCLGCFCPVPFSPPPGYFLLISHFTASRKTSAAELKVVPFSTLPKHRVYPFPCVWTHCMEPCLICSRAVLLCPGHQCESPAFITGLEFLSVYSSFVKEMADSMFSPVPSSILHDLGLWAAVPEFARTTILAFTQGPAVYAFTCRHRIDRDDLCLANKVSGLSMCTHFRNTVLFLLWTIGYVSPRMQVRLFVSHWDNKKDWYNIDRKWWFSSWIAAQLLGPLLINMIFQRCRNTGQRRTEVPRYLAYIMLSIQILDGGLDETSQKYLPCLHRYELFTS